MPVTSAEESSPTERPPRRIDCLACSSHYEEQEYNSDISDEQFEQNARESQHFEKINSEWFCQDHWGTCDDCEEIFQNEDLQPVNDQQFCTDHYQTCQDCGTFAPIDADWMRQAEDGPYCEDCSSYCDLCEEVFPIDQVGFYEENGEYLCEGCVITCHHCNTTIPESIATSDDDGRTVCQQCSDSTSTYECAECHQTRPSNAIRMVWGREENGKYVCARCMGAESGIIIKHLGTHDGILNLLRTTQGEETTFVLEHAVSRSRRGSEEPIKIYIEIPTRLIQPMLQAGIITTCSQRGPLHYVLPGAIQSSGACTLCHIIKQEENMPISKIGSYHSHSYTGKFKHMKKDLSNKEKMYFGIELETEFVDQPGVNMDYEIKGRTVLDALSGLYVGENDGSLRNGVEFISMPMSYEFIRSKTHINKLTTAMEIAHTLGAKNDLSTTAGLHVHVSRAAFDRPGKSRGDMEDDINWILTGFQRYMEVLARRPENNYCTYPMKMIKASQTFNIASRMFIDKKSVPKGGRAAINFGGSHDTYEFRIFNSTGRVDYIMAAVEMVRNISLCVINEDDIVGKTFKDIIFYKEAPYLKRYIDTLLLTRKNELEGWNSRKVKAEIELKKDNR